MSNSARAKKRRSRRSGATKHQRAMMAGQHFGNAPSVRRSETKSKRNAPGGLSVLEQRMQDLRSKLGGL